MHLSVCQEVCPSPPLYLVEYGPCSLAAIDQGPTTLRTWFLSWLSNHGRHRFCPRITMVFGFFSGGFDLGPFLHFLSSCSYDLSSLPNDMSEAVPNSVLSPSTFHMRQLYQSLISLSLQNLKYSLLNPALKDSSSLHNSFPLVLSSLPFCLKSWYLHPLFLSSLL